MEVYVVVVTEDGCKPRVGRVFRSEEKAIAYGRQQEEDWGAFWHIAEREVEE